MLPDKREATAERWETRRDAPVATARQTALRNSPTRVRSHPVSRPISATARDKTTHVVENFPAVVDTNARRRDGRHQEAAVGRPLLHRRAVRAGLANLFQLARIPQVHGALQIAKTADQLTPVLVG